MTVSAAARALWAKSPGGGDDWHPLIAHLLDVAACARAILEREPASTRALYAADLGLDEPRALAWVCALVGLHDLGKASPAFQQKWPQGRDQVWAAGLTWPDGAPPAKPPRDIPHGVITQATLPELLAGAGWPLRAARRVADAIGAHHGFRARKDELDRALGKAQQGFEAWAAARKELFDALLAALEAGPAAPRAIGGAAFERIAGLTSFADWIGSSLPRARFDGDTRGYFAGALARARHALDTIGWLPRAALLPAGEAPSLARVFGYLGRPGQPFRPRALQRAMEPLLEAPSGPALYLIEAPMGEGKTEAALYAHLRLQAASGHRGLYMALPTQSTGNAMFARLTAFLTEQANARGGGARPIDLQLLHGATLLNPDFQRLVVQPNVAAADAGDEDSPDAPREGVRAAEWFTHRKRGLLSEYGVGTVDQALLAVLNTRWQFVRLWGLANRVVVLDEVHAYDTYTGTLIESLVRWLRALGSSVILMSATLPTAKRRALLDAYGATSDEAPTPYPRITRVAGGVATSATFRGRAQPTLAVKAAPDDLPALAAFLRDLARDGGCVGCIVNTVKRAQDLHRLLRAEVDPDEVYLFHARYPADERQHRETRVLDMFGPGDAARPRRAILIATQVAEQSLDLDFDVLVTELAPVDLVLQRAGRLHRHERPAESRHGHRAPVLYVAGLATGAAVPRFGDSERIYAPYVLLRSWLALRDRATIDLPGDIDRLVQEVYSPTDPAGLAPALAEALRRANALLTNREEGSGAAATTAVFGEADETGWLDLPSQVRHDDDEADRQADDDRPLPGTREGRPSVTVIPVHAHEGRYYRDAAHTDEVRLTGTIARDEAIGYYGRSVRLSHGAIVGGIRRHVEEEKVPLAGWQKIPLLAQAYPLVLREGRAVVGRQAVRLDAELGVVYEEGATAMHPP